jgi:hypothetical protein
MRLNLDSGNTIHTLSLRRVRGNCFARELGRPAQRRLADMPPSLAHILAELPQRLADKDAARGGYVRSCASHAVVHH